MTPIGRITQRNVTMFSQSNEVVEDFISHHKEKKETGGNTEGKYTGKSFRGTCHFCQERGHYAIDCPKRKVKLNAEQSNTLKRKGKDLLIVLKKRKMTML